MSNYWYYLLVMFLTTYLIRVLPFTIFTKKIKSRFINDFLAYVPYAVLASMTIPAIIFSTDTIVSAFAALLVAIVLAYRGCSLIVVALSSSATVLVVDLVMSLFFSCL